MAKIKSLLELTRPANVVTAWADILAGAAIALGAGSTMAVISGGGWLWAANQLTDLDLWGKLVWLIISTSGLYAGGVVLNDVFDAELDAAERPERAIPSGRVSKRNATILAILLLALGAYAAVAVSSLSGYIAAAIVVLVTLYNRFSKHHAILGPVNMGLCRAGNLLLGMSIIPSAVLWPLGVLPLLYIGAITAVSQGEVHGGSKKTGYLGVGLVLVMLLGLVVLLAIDVGRLFSAGIFLLLFTWLVLPSFLRAARAPEATNIRRAVGAGIMGLIPLNAALAAGAAGWSFGLIVLLLLPISIALSRLFAVT